MTASGQFVNIYNEVGTPGTIPATSNIYLQAERLDEEAAPRGERDVVINPAMNATIVPCVLQGLFNPQRDISEQFRKGMMSKDTLGYDWYMDQNCRIQTVGPLGGTPLVNGANQTGSTLLTKGWTAAAASRLNVGDVFTLGSGTTGVYAVNPQNLQIDGSFAAVCGYSRIQLGWFRKRKRFDFSLDCHYWAICDREAFLPRMAQPST